MIYIVLNAIPILLATLAGLVAGWLLHRTSGAPTRGLVTAALAEAWFAAILAGALILAPDKAPPWVMAVMTALVIWIGFVAPALVVTLRHRDLGWRAVGVEAGYWLAVMVVQAVVLKLVGLVPPPV
ncbi:hypothetical protein IP88_13735 [alpha proteobacterium AAP81b]|nr:hypothetical protein IP88_13735 [alpha proteobacterium AAP81b]